MSEPDSEVEDILNEIRLTVQREKLARPSREIVTKSAVPAVFNANTQPNIHEVPVASPSRLPAHLLTLERTRNNLPPVVSFRSGLPARLELFIKRQVKRLTKWYVWDQLRFNNAVYDSVTELRKVETSMHQLEAAIREIAARPPAPTLEMLIREIEARIPASPPQGPTSAEFEELRRELRERLQLLADEQRVVYKNLLMQMSEASVATGEWRRNLEERLAVLEKGERKA